MGDRHGSSNASFTIRSFLIEPSRNRVSWDDEVVQMEPMVMHVLCVLAEHAGEVVARDALIDRVWGVEHGADERLIRAISILRKVFRRSGDKDGLIETIPKNGYRLTQPVEYIREVSEAGEADTQPSHLNIQADKDAARQKPGKLAALLSRPKFLWVSFGGLAALVCVAVVTTLWQATPTPLTDSAARTQDGKVTISLAAFKPLSAQNEIRFFSAGLDDELRSRLADVPNVEILDQDADATSASKAPAENKLNTEYALKGTIRQDNDSYRVSVQLVRMMDRVQIWSETFHHLSSDDVVAQNTVAGEISRSLQARLGVGAGAGRVALGTVPPAAYEYYLRGVAAWSGRTEPKNRREAIKSFRLAVTEAPDFADAWARLGISLTLSLPDVAELTLDASNNQAEHALNRSITLAPANVQSHVGLSTFFLRRRLNIEKSEMYAKEAIELEPDSSGAHYALAMTLLAKGRYTEAHLAFDRSIALAPDNHVPQLHKMISLAGKGNVASAREMLEGCDQCPLVDAYIVFIAALQDGSQTEIQSAIEEYAQYAERYVEMGGSPNAVSALDEFQDLVDIFVHKKDEALGWQEWMNDAQPSMIMASTYAHIGETERAINMLNELRRRSAFLEGFELVSHGPPLAFPETFVRTPQYREIWNAPEMVELSAIRRKNGRNEGLPPL